jgi:hypothetical protein
LEATTRCSLNGIDCRRAKSAVTSYLVIRMEFQKKQF